MSDPREELARLIYEQINGTGWDALDVGSVVLVIHKQAAFALADAVLAAGYRKLSDLASDPDVVEKVAKAWHEYEFGTAAAIPDLSGYDRDRARRFLSNVVAALAATQNGETRG